MEKTQKGKDLTVQYRIMGRTGLKVSAICLGTMTYGNQIKQAEAIDIMNHAFASGINFFDTADSYAEGKSEEIVGKAIRDKRDQVVLATKVASKVGSGPNDGGLSRKHILQGVEESLRRLGTDYIDLYYAHIPDYDTPIEETLRAFHDLVFCGKVRYIACSNFYAWQLCKSLWISDRSRLSRFECIQSPYNLLTRDIEYELLPLCASEGVGVTVYNPLAAGLLTGKHDPTQPPCPGRFSMERLGPVYYERYWSTPNFAAVARLKQIAESNGRSLAPFSLAWILSNPTITSVIIGASSIKQLEENLGAVGLKLTSEELSGCDDVWRQLRPLRFFYGR
jgi:aryl-alcohol dehydrogenase-like predicted oxidoreductase